MPDTRSGGEREREVLCKQQASAVTQATQFLAMLLLSVKEVESTLLYDMRPQVGTWKRRGRKNRC